MSMIEDFLSKAEEKAIVDAIRKAEKNTSGEIRVHIENHTEEDHYEHAQKIFRQLHMHETKLRNGVLIYIAVTDHKFVILGDEGINKKVGKHFWEDTKNLMQSHFIKGEFTSGIIAGVLQAGEQLKSHFPWQSDDVNELPNEISKG